MRNHKIIQCRVSNKNVNSKYDDYILSDHSQEYLMQDISQDCIQENDRMTRLYAMNYATRLLTTFRTSKFYHKIDQSQEYKL